MKPMKPLHIAGILGMIVGSVFPFYFVLKQRR